MDKKEFSEAIEEGILNGFWKPITQFIIGMFILVLLVFGYTAYQNYQQDKCLESGECSLPMSAGSSAPEGQITCYVYAVNETETIQVSTFTSMGYQEAKIEYEFLKPTINRLINRTYPNHTSQEISCQ